MRAGDKVYRIIRAISTETNTPNANLTIDDFLIEAMSKPYGQSNFVGYDHASTVVNLSGGKYQLEYNSPTSPGWVDYYITPTTSGDIVFDSHWSGEVENMDFDSLHSSVSSPSFAPIPNAVFGNKYPISLFAYRYAPLDVVVSYNDGTAFDFSTYSNLKLSVRSPDQTEIKLDAANGTPTGFVLTASDDTLHIEFPETTGTFGTSADIYSWIAPGEFDGGAPLYYEVTGDLGGDATKTMTIIPSSELYIKRREVET